MIKPPDQIAFEQDINDPLYKISGDGSKWRLTEQSWPDCIFEVRAKCGKWWALRINLEGYPEQAPKGMFWSIKEERPLDGTTETPNALGCRDKAQDSVFLALSSQENSIYAPFDRFRVGNSGYDDSGHEKCWKPGSNITFYLENIHEILHSVDYLTPQNPQA